MTTKTTDEIEDQYTARGITPETWACISVMTQRDAKDYLWRLAAAGVPAKLSRDADGKRWHVAIQGGLKASPMAWLVTIRPDEEHVPTCPVDHVSGQHPQATA